MYTRCPSCRSEISFDPPANKDSLPENYRHRIKCPSCGVTIGVKINQNPQILSQPMSRPALAAPPGARNTAPQRQATQRTNAYSAPRANTYGGQRAAGAYGNQRNAGYGAQKTNNYGATRTNQYNAPRNSAYANSRADMYDDEPQEMYEQPVKQSKKATKAAPVSNKNAQARQNAKAEQRSDKKNGTLRNLIMMVFSAVFIALAAVSYLTANGTITLPESFVWVKAASYFDGITVWAHMINSFELFKGTMAAAGALGGFAILVPLLLFTLSCINFIVAFISMCGRKYGRAFNVIFSLIIGGLAATALFAPYLIKTDGDVIGYLVDVIGAKGYLAIAGAIWGVLQFIISLCFIKSLVRKEPEPERGGKGRGKAASSKKSNSKSGKKNAKNSKRR